MWLITVIPYVVEQPAPSCRREFSEEPSCPGLVQVGRLRPGERSPMTIM